MTIEQEYGRLASAFTARAGVEAGQMFGKSCLKVGGKAFLAWHLDTVVFKLAGTDHAAALALAGAKPWDPSGKGRPMKAWIALPIGARPHFDRLAEAALSYVGG